MDICKILNISEKLIPLTSNKIIVKGITTENKYLITPKNIFSFKPSFISIKLIVIPIACKINSDI